MGGLGSLEGLGGGGGGLGSLGRFRRFRRFGVKICAYYADMVKNLTMHQFRLLFWYNFAYWQYWKYKRLYEKDFYK